MLSKKFEERIREQIIYVFSLYSHEELTQLLRFKY